LATPTKKSFELLLSLLDSVTDRAAEKYEGLRLRLVKYFVWSCGCPESWADSLADETLDRIALKLERGTIVENIRAYSLATARFIWLEHGHKFREENLAAELHDRAAETPEAEGSDERYLCLKSCLVTTIKNESDRTLILEYYNTAEGEKNKDHRKRLAQSQGLELGALKVRMCRLRQSLEKCIRDCLRNKAAGVTN
jgi:DNA-directed RNA polymerase specialized sigma24 family protein